VRHSRWRQFVTGALPLKFIKFNIRFPLHPVAGASLQLVPYHQNIDNFIFVFMLVFLKIHD
jgi:hypothetical protein